jgi:hypothetical protein
MILFSFFGSLMLAGIVAYLFERWGWSHNGSCRRPDHLRRGSDPLFPRALFGLSFGSPGVDAIIGSAAALILIPTESRIAGGRRTAAARDAPAACCNAAVALGCAAIYRLRKSNETTFADTRP